MEKKIHRSNRINGSKRICAQNKARIARSTRKSPIDHDHILNGLETNSILDYGYLAIRITVAPFVDRNTTSVSIPSTAIAVITTPTYQPAWSRRTHRDPSQLNSWLFPPNPTTDPLSHITHTRPDDHLSCPGQFTSNRFLTPVCSSLTSLPRINNCRAVLAAGCTLCWLSFEPAAAHEPCALDRLDRTGSELCTPREQVCRMGCQISRGVIANENRRGAKMNIQ
jgi:hypothetical protein